MAKKTAAQTLVTQDPEAIRHWAEERGGKPAVVGSTHKEEGSGVLRINFEGYSGEESLEEIEWDEFFEIFEERGLAFLYQEETKDGRTSRFFKFVNADTLEKKKAGNE